MMKSMAIVAGLLCVLCQQVTAQRIVVESDFEGGSARVIEVDSQRGFIRIMPSGDPLRGWPAWWYCRLGGLRKNQTLQLSVFPSAAILPTGRPGGGKPLSSSWALPNRAAWSADGHQWQQTSPGKRDGAGMVYELTAQGSELWIAWGPPATPTTMNKWLDDTATEYDCVDTFELATTREGRPVRGIRIASGEKPIATRPVLWLHARQHAWESGSSWVARGIGDWLVADSQDANWIRQNAQTWIVPIMDVDRVTTGDGGKESTPHDHNRDWSKDPHYPEVAAAQKRITAWASENRVVVFVDLHNPGPNDQKAYFYVAPDEAIESSGKLRRTRFLDTIQAAYDGPIPLDRRSRSTGPNYHPLWQQISSTWVTQHAGDASIAVCLETPWNTANSTIDGYHQVGAGLMKGIARHLRSQHEDQDTSPK